MLVKPNRMEFIESNGGQLTLIDSWCMPGNLFKLFGNSVSFTSHKATSQIKVGKTL